MRALLFLELTLMGGDVAVIDASLGLFRQQVLAEPGRCPPYASPVVLSLQFLVVVLGFDFFNKFWFYYFYKKGPKNGLPQSINWDPPKTAIFGHFRVFGLFCVFLDFYDFL